MSKISELSDGGSLQSTDYLIAVRSGGNVKVQADGNLSLGALTLTGLTVDTNTLHVDATNNRVGVGTTSPAAPLSVGSITGDTYAVFDDGLKARLTFNGDASAAKIFATTTGFATYEDLEFRADNYLFKNGTTERMRIDSSGNLLVGRSGHSGYGKLNVEGGADFTGGNVLLCRDTGNVGIGTASPITSFTLGSGTTGVSFQSASSTFNSGKIAVVNPVEVGSGNGHLVFETYGGGAGGGERMRIDATGNVGIGTSSPQSKLDVGTTSDGAGVIASYRANGFTTRLDHGTLGTSVAHFYTGGASSLALGTDSTERMRITSAGNVGIGVTDPDQKLEVNGVIKTSMGSGGLSLSGYSSPDLGYFGYNYFNNNGTETVGQSVRSSHRITMGNGATNAITFDYRAPNAAAGTWSERARLDASGNLLVGTTDTNPTTGTSEGIVAQAGGLLLASNYQDAALALNRTSNDGSIAVFKKDGTTVGIISVDGVDFIIDSTQTDSAMALQWNDGGTLRKLQGYQTAFRMNTANDATVDLGGSTSRFKDLYLSGGVYLGGTGAANLLDDYEEGVFTPTFGGSTTNPTVIYAVQSGVYTKIGNLVTATVVVGTTANTGGAGSIQIKGLPFVSKNASEYRARDMINTFNLDVDTNCIGVGVEGVQNGNYLLMLESRDNQVWRQVDWSQATSASIYFAFTFQYYV